MTPKTTGLQNRVVLVSGSSSGIGRAIAIAFGREEARVAITYHTNRDGAEETADRVREAGGDAFIIQYDMTNHESIDTAVQAVIDHWGTINVLVNNAVPSDIRPIPFGDIQLGEWQRLVHGIQDGVFQTVQTALPAMRDADWGRIINISSSSAEIGSENMAPYATAKAGIHGLTRVLATELGETGILSNVVMPGMVLTEKNLEQVPQSDREAIAEQTPSRQITTPEDVADLVVFLGSPANGNVNGTIVPVTGGLNLRR
ncbi:SDR family NAD(P)-dependent oxidoreductase [Haladaptatus halobius]|uniref:SDR family NAD(P)-dependent oxidoreductase n=1 Tax=Haladaptatus halobius TaxID=2884875 RepID=UPI001D09D5E6|nr:SDR family NAD(P)-dependent oxidoreductase [Haladaptatus halobius]